MTCKKLNTCLQLYKDYYVNAARHTHFSLAHSCPLNKLLNDLLGAFPYEISLMLIESNNDNGKTWIRPLVRVEWCLHRQSFHGHLLLLLLLSRVTSYSWRYSLVSTSYSLQWNYFIWGFLNKLIFNSLSTLLGSVTMKVWMWKYTFFIHRVAVVKLDHRYRIVPIMLISNTRSLWLVITSPDDRRTRRSLGLTCNAAVKVMNNLSPYSWIKRISALFTPLKSLA